MTKLLPEITESVHFTVGRIILPGYQGDESWLYVEQREKFHFSEVTEAISECKRRTTTAFADNPFFVVEVNKKTIIRKVDS